VFWIIVQNLMLISDLNIFFKKSAPKKGRPAILSGQKNIFWPDIIGSFFIQFFLDLEQALNPRYFNTHVTYLEKKNNFALRTFCNFLT
jgi:hypothetical protein